MFSLKNLSLFDSFSILIRRFFLSLIFLFTLFPLRGMSIRKKLGFEENLKLKLFFKEVVVTCFLVAVTVLSFILIQFRYLFNQVKETELIKFGVKTYSEYVTKGFYELIFASLIIFGVTSFSYLVLQENKIKKKSFLWFLNLFLLGELLILLFSVFRRLFLYQQFHGLTLARIYGSFFSFGWE